MHYLEAIFILNSILDMLQAGTRVQIQKQKLKDVKGSLSQVLLLLGDDYKQPTIMLIVEDLFVALDIAEKSEILVVPYVMKATYEKAIKGLKYEISVLAYKYFNTHEFEDTEEIRDIMLEVVTLYKEGLDA